MSCSGKVEVYVKSTSSAPQPENHVHYLFILNILCPPALRAKRGVALRVDYPLPFGLRV